MPESAREETAALVQQELAKVLESKELSQSDRLRSFLQFVVQATLAGNTSHLKESVVGVEVFGKEPGYDPKQDPVVRVTAGRLRTKLDHYYETEGRADPVRIVLPKGGYVPEFVRTTSEPAATVAARAPRPWRGWWLVTAAGLIVAAMAIVLWRRPPTARFLTETKTFTSFAGSESRPTFSPDGQALAFDWDGPRGENTDIYVQPLTADAPVRMTEDPAPDISPVWSPDGSQIAFLRILSAARVGIYSRPAASQGERKWTEVERGPSDQPRLDWSPDGARLLTSQRLTAAEPSALVEITLQTGARRRLTQPPLGSLGDSEAAYSPDGRFIAFRRGASNSVEDVWILPATGGTAQQLTFDNRGISGLAWAADSQSVIVSSKRATSIRSLWRIPLAGGAPEQLTTVAVDAGSPAVARQGNRLAFTNHAFDVNIWEYARDQQTTRVVVNSTLLDSGPQYSPDGARIAFRSNRTGNDEVWTCDRNGENLSKLTNVHGSLTGSPRWSPDGRRLVFESRLAGNGDIYTVDAGGGAARKLTPESSNEILPSWSRDGRFVYFASDRSGSWQVWRTPAEGGTPEQVTRQGGWAAFESLDGRHLFFSKGSLIPGVWRMPLPQGSGPETLIVDTAPQMWGNWAVAGTGLYFLDWRPGGPAGVIRQLDWSTGKTETLVQLTNLPASGDSGLAVSPDERRILFSQVDRHGADILLVERFR